MAIRPTPAASPPVPIRFDDIAARAGIHFTLRNSATGGKHQIETMIAGVAVLDYNNDAKPDIYFVNGARIPDLVKSGPEFHNRLYRNGGDGTFQDVTVHAGVAGTGYGMGVATADYDNDGFADIFLPGVDHNILYRNRGDGTFEDVTKAAGLEGKRWAVAAGWFDYDNDGWLDLFVVNYCVWNLATEPACGDPKAGFRTYCDPRIYQGLPNQLYRNNGDGTFANVSRQSGIAAHIGKGMGVAFADYDQDGDLDVFVANDTVPNFLFRNDGRGGFQEVGLKAGVALNDDGRALSSMGVDFRDYDNDGREDIFVSALTNETFPLFRNLGKGFFLDVTHPSHVGKATLPASGWSSGIYDFNNDGHKDIFVAAGDVQDNTELLFSRKSKQSNLLLANLGDGKFAPQFIGHAAHHRGAAFGDFDEDGSVDAVVTRLNEPAALYRNVSPARNNWLALRLRGARSNRDAIGARIRIVTSSGREQWNHVTTSVGYAGASDKTVHFGLGADTFVKLAEIRWPDGTQQTLENLKAGQLVLAGQPSLHVHADE